MQGPLHLQTREQPWIDWICLKGQTSLLQVTTNLLYHCSVDSLRWLSSKADEEFHEEYVVARCATNGRNGNDDIHARVQYGNVNWRIAFGINSKASWTLNG